MLHLDGVSDTSSIALAHTDPPLSSALPAQAAATPRSDEPALASRAALASRTIDQHTSSTQGLPTRSVAKPVARTQESRQGCRLAVIRRIERIHIRFRINMTALDQAARTALTEVGSAYLTCPVGIIDVVGYTDAQGVLASNLKLSEERARIVATYLAQHGIPEGRLHVLGRGPADPLTTNETVSGRWKNRRVVLRVRRET